MHIICSCTVALFSGFIAHLYAAFVFLGSSVMHILVACAGHFISGFLTHLPLLSLDMADLLRRLKVLEDKEKGENLEALITQIETYGTRRKDDFDKYRALALAENLVHVSRQQQHKKASFFAVSAQALRDRIAMPTDHFQAYFIALSSRRIGRHIRDFFGTPAPNLKVN